MLLGHLIGSPHRTIQLQKQNSMRAWTKQRASDRPRSSAERMDDTDGVANTDVVDGAGCADGSTSISASRPTPNPLHTESTKEMTSKYESPSGQGLYSLFWFHSSHAMTTHGRTYKCIPPHIQDQLLYIAHAIFSDANKARIFCICKSLQINGATSSTRTTSTSLASRDISGVWTSNDNRMGTIHEARQKWTTPFSPS